MEECNICGARNANRKARIEEVILTVCNNCVNLGEEIPMIKIKIARKSPQKIRELEETIVPTFSKVIKAERERHNISQEELAKKLSEKVSVIRRIEEGWEPSLTLVKKLEKFFNMKLTEKIDEQRTSKKEERKSLTIGDIVEID